MLYDEDGNEYPMDNTGQQYVPLKFEPAGVKEAQVENEKSIKN